MASPTIGVNVDCCLFCIIGIGLSWFLPLWLRISCMSGSYCNDESRRLILEAIRWSFQALCNLFCKNGAHAVPYISIFAIYMIHSLMLGLGTGRYPSHDPWNKPFSKEYCKSRWMLSGQPIADGYVSILDGVQGDQDFIRILFNPSRPSTQMGRFMLIFLFDYNPKMEDNSDSDSFRVGIHVRFLFATTVLLLL